MDTINQKEYLKKYLGFGKVPGEKRKKKKLKGISNRVTIIDDDVETFTNIVIEEDPLLASEDAPQIVAIIDERPPSLRVDDKTKNPLWQPIGTTETTNSGEQKQMITGFKIAKLDDKPFARPADRSPPRRRKIQNSPPRKSKADQHPPAKNRTGNEESSSKYKTEGYSPPRKSRQDDNTPPRMTENDDYSPPRKSRSDGSPPRKSKRGDKSPQGNDYSPPRRSRNDSSPPRKSKRWDSSPPGRSESRDHSPRRSRTNGDDISPLRNSRRDKSKDMSPLRRRRGSEGDNSPPRKTKKNHSKDDISPPRRSVSVTTMSPLRRSKGGDSKYGSPSRKSRSKTQDISPGRKEDSTKKKHEISTKMQKTLDGKSAGLQNAHQLVEETKEFRQKEDQLFKNLPQEVSGQNAETVFRDRKSGKIRNLAEEEDRQQKKREEEQKNKEKYTRWGRGLVQVESRDQQIKDELYEMSKPLARYADDADLEKYLKEQEREGDPMLAYIRSKRRKKATEKGIPEKPEFQGQFMPNRFGIRPGHRWDGVDRSNGYEKKWFEVQNARRAQQEDVYRWSTEDM